MSSPCRCHVLCAFLIRPSLTIRRGASAVAADNTAVRYLIPRAPRVQYNSKSTDHIAASWQLVILKRNATRGHTCVRAMATTCPSKLGVRHPPHRPHNVSLGRERRCLPMGCIAIARGCHNNINPELLEHNEYEGKINDPFHINTSRMGMPHAHRVIAGVMNLTFAFFSFFPGAPSLALPRLASSRRVGFNTSTAGPFFEPSPALALAANPPFRTPRLLRASARAVRCGAVRTNFTPSSSRQAFISRGPSARLAWSHYSTVAVGGYPRLVY
jgi:hypothetical protein